MERIYLLKGLDCPNCAAKIETEAGKLPEVKTAAVNLMKQTLTVETEAEGDELTEKIGKIVHAHEPDVAVKEIGKDAEAHESAYVEEHEHGHGEEEEGSVRLRVGKLIAGTVLLVCGFVLPLLADTDPRIRIAFFAAAWLVAGYDVVWHALRGIVRGEFFDECFLMTVSTVGAFAVGEWPEAAAVMLFYQLGELFQDIATDRSRDSITALMDIRPDTATVRRDGGWIAVSPEEVEIGETILVKPGEKIPLDGVVRKGGSSVDTRALTGESVPRYWSAGDAALSGCVAEDGTLEIEVTKEAGESTAAKILALCESAAEKKAPAETFITKFSRIYTPVVCALALLLAVIPPLAAGGAWSEWIRRGCVVLAVSCPCALVISVPLTFFGGIGAASRQGVLVKGSAYLESLASLDAVVFDKTGTLTEGSFSVTEIVPADGFSRDEVLELAARAETCSSHPIARSILKAYDEIGEIDAEDSSEVREIAGRGVCAVWQGRTILAGNASLMKENGIELPAGESGGGTVFVGADGRYAGRLTVEDSVKKDAAEAVRGLRALGVGRIEMLTGDGEEAARKVAEELGLDGYKSGLLPEDKARRLDAIKTENGLCAFVGDGINDAPVLAGADIGVAMGGLGSDAAIEAADIVLMTDEPTKLCTAVRTARKTRRIVQENIWFAVAVKAAFIALGGLGLCGMWAAVLGDVGVMILAVLNALRVMR